MATIVQREGKRGTVFQAWIRRNGVSVRKTFRTRSAAAEWARRIEGDQDKARAIGSPGGRMRLRELVELYTRDLDARKKTVPCHVALWEREFGDTRICDLHPADIERELDRYSNGVTSERVEKPTAASRNRMKSALSSVFRFAKRKHLWTVNPCTEVVTMPEPKGRTRWLSDDERERLFKACRASTWDKLYLLVLAALGTGARASELVVKLSWSAIDWKERTAVIERTKNGDPKTLTFPKPVVEELMRFRPKQDSDEAKGLVFGRKEAPGLPFTWRKSWDAALEAAELEDFRFHDLRHTTASELVSAGESLYTVGQILGHRNPQSTARYAHLSVEAKQKSSDRVLGKLLAKR